MKDLKMAKMRRTSIPRKNMNAGYMMPGMMPGMQMGMMPGMQQGMMPGMQQGMMPGTQPVQQSPAPVVQYNVLVNGQTTGPYNMSVLTQMIKNGQLTPQTQVWKQGMAGWVAAGTVQEISRFFPQQQSAPPPPVIQFNVAINGQSEGPYDMATLAEMSKTSQLTLQSQVWRQGMPGWAAAGTVQELIDLIANNPPPKTWEDYYVPVDGILDDYVIAECLESDADIQANATIIEDTLAEFKIEAKVTGFCKGPVVTMFEVLPAPGIKLSKIASLEDNISLRLATRGLRILCPIPGKQAVGIEVPNKKRAMVNFRELLESADDPEDCNKALPLYLGKTISGELFTADLASLPHLLVAGTTGSGKSVCINSMILSLIYRQSPAQCRMIFVDAKVVELTFYNGIPHLLTPVITDPKRALVAMRYCVDEMERRYQLLSKLSARNIKSYNKSAADKGMPGLPYIVVIIDEFADLMAVSSKELEGLIARLAAKSRAVGIHLVLATQRPSVNVITGLIKSNIPARIAFMVSSNVDSRIILDTPGAEKLLGRGDMLYSGNDPFPIRAQGAYVSEDEADRTVDFLKTLGSPEFVEMK